MTITTVTFKINLLGLFTVLVTMINTVKGVSLIIFQCEGIVQSHKLFEKCTIPELHQNSSVKK